MAENVAIAVATSLQNIEASAAGIIEKKMVPSILLMPTCLPERNICSSVLLTRSVIYALSADRQFAL